MHGNLSIPSLKRVDKFFKDFLFNDAIWMYTKFMALQIPVIKFLISLKINSLPLKILERMYLVPHILPYICFSFMLFFSCFCINFVSLHFFNWIHLGSIALLPFLPVPLIFSITLTLHFAHFHKLFEFKYFDKILQWLYLDGFLKPDLCQLSLLFSSWTVSPTYCNWLSLHVTRYIHSY